MKKPPAADSLRRAPACVDCAHCTRTQRGRGNHTYLCALYGDCHAARFGGACGLAALAFSQRTGRMAAPAPMQQVPIPRPALPTLQVHPASL